jgi:anti-anti-sigma regulatory factor
MEQSNTVPPTVTLSGSLTVAEAESIRATLLKAMDAGDVVVDCSAATEVDLSFVQLLIAAQRAAALQGGSLRLAAPASGALLETLLRAGMLSSPTDQATSEAAFWSERSAA